MRDTQHNILFQFLRSQLESVHALPEHVRKMFMAVTMIFATAFVGLASWLLFPPLQDIGLPSLNTNQRINNNYKAMDDLKQIVKDSEFANVINVPEIGPASGFMQSFKAVQDLVVPKNLQNPLEYVRGTAPWPSSWLTPLSRASAGAALKLREASLLGLEGVNKLITYIVSIIVLLASYITSWILYALSYLAGLSSYISHLLDLFVSSTSRMAI